MQRMYEGNHNALGTIAQLVLSAAIVAAVLVNPLPADAQATPVAQGAPAAQPLQEDNPSCKDHELFTRMPDSWIASCSDKTFDFFEFMTGLKTTTRVEGRTWKITYYP
jgi:hypothetical protein